MPFQTWSPWEVTFPGWDSSNKIFHLRAGKIPNSQHLPQYHISHPIMLPLPGSSDMLRSPIGFPTIHYNIFSLLCCFKSFLLSKSDEFRGQAPLVIITDHVDSIIQSARCPARRSEKAEAKRMAFREFLLTFRGSKYRCCKALFT